ncbi:hypothetical protein GQS52_21945 [Streptomyces sp. SCUT-3]|uniref:hypothetical protein n=1 Tax=Streptomyces sp. SCUT-3 TaxID=2684469 RepID=UPI000CC42A7E|nr:hypothetical protein [Streptomyces sp. SCUT-3]PLW73635.1 hypothetical protein C0036_06200 [Streptomyces sp. DJ]QMV24008.1 hypothetical protein GQS52_21945 [Streptomyces sp. SCUT-3]
MSARGDLAFALGSYRTRSPSSALGWLLLRGRDVADQLAPAAARPVRHWLRDRHEHERALAALADGGTYTFTAHEDGVRYLLTAGPRDRASTSRP